MVLACSRSVLDRVLDKVPEQTNHENDNEEQTQWEKEHKGMRKET